MTHPVRHVLGISGGKDSAALALYMHAHYPHLPIEYYTCDTGKELEETYELIDRLEGILGKKILKLASTQSELAPFDHFLRLNRGYLPSSTARWCTRKLKLEPFEKFVGDDTVISYVGIRHDEDRDGYISTKSNIQSVFPFRKNIWSEEIIRRMLHNDNLPQLCEWYDLLADEAVKARGLELMKEPVSPRFTIQQKRDALLAVSIASFNRVCHAWQAQTGTPVGQCDDFPLVENEEGLVREDIFRILEDSGAGIPAYYKKIAYEVDGQQGEYARSRSGCFFCFYQQKIEWIWLYEQHPDKFREAMEYEKDGYTWMQDERLEDLLVPARMNQIKADHIKRTQRTAAKQKSSLLLDILAEAEGDGCVACFV